MKRCIQRIIYTGLIFSLLSSLSFAAEINSRYAKLIYRDEEQLSEFNEKGLNAVSYNEKSAALADDVKNKLDLFVERCFKILIDGPLRERLRFKIVILALTGDIRKIYSESYGKSTDYIAFYSPKVDTVFISVEELRPGILAHEIAHVIIQHYFYNTPSRMVHEAIARTVETQIEK